MGLDDIAMNVKGYWCSYYHYPCTYAVLQYSPFDGKELECGFFWELQMEIGDALEEEDINAYEKWCGMLYKMRPAFDINAIPKHLMHMLNERSWYYELKEKERAMHKNGKFCGWFHLYIGTCYEYNSRLPAMAETPIYYCPFCGVKLQREFSTMHWWEKEFATFNWQEKYPDANI